MKNHCLVNHIYITWFGHECIVHLYQLHVLLLSNPDSSKTVYIWKKSALMGKELNIAVWNLL